MSYYVIKTRLTHISKSICTKSDRQVDTLPSGTIDARLQARGLLVLGSLWHESFCSFSIKPRFVSYRITSHFLHEIEVEGFREIIVQTGFL